MNELRFEPRMFTFGSDKYPSPVADIYIDDENFLDRVHAYKEGPGFLYISELYDSLHNPPDADGVLIAGCCCGVAECDPLYVHIGIGENVVVWYDFFYPSTSKVDEDETMPIPPLIPNAQEFYQSYQKMLMSGNVPADWIHYDAPPYHGPEYWGIEGIR